MAYAYIYNVCDTEIIPYSHLYMNNYDNTVM